MVTLHHDDGLSITFEKSSGKVPEAWKGETLIPFLRRGKGGPRGQEASEPHLCARKIMELILLEKMFRNMREK